MIRKYRSLLLILLLLVVLPLALLMVKQSQEIRKKAAANDMSVFLARDTIAPGGTTTGGVTVEVGQSPVDTAAIRLTYDSSKITVTEFNCGSGLNESPSNRDNTLGNLLIVCSKPQGFTTTFGAATFTVTAGSATGDVNISLGTNTQIRSSGSVLTGNLNAKTLHISSAGAQVPVFFSFGSSAVSPGGSNSGTVKVTAGTSLVKTVRAIIAYDPTKISVSNLACKKQNPSNFPSELGLQYRTGEAEITCSSATGVTGNVLDVANFDIQVLSTASTGTVTVSFSQATKLWTTDGAELTATLTPGNFQVGQMTPTPTATPPPGGVTVNPTCIAPGGSVTITGSGFGTTQGNVHMTTSDVLGYCSKYSCGVNIGSTSWSDTQIVSTIPNGTSTGIKAIAIFKSGAGDTDYIKPAPQITVSNNCIVVTPTPTIAAQVTPTPTLPPGTSPTPTPTGTAVAGSTLVFKLKFYAINAKPTTPAGVAGLDYEHESAAVLVKSLDNSVALVTNNNVLLTAGDNGVYTSAAIDTSTLPPGKYNLHVKPVGYFQKRFAAVTFTKTTVVDLSPSPSGYRFEPGDLNNDRVVNLTDFNDIVNFKETTDQATTRLTVAQYKKYDVDRNGILNAGDIDAVRETLLHRYDDE